MIKQAILLFYVFWYLFPAIFTLINPYFVTELYRGGISLLTIIYSTLFCSLTYYFSTIKFNFHDIKQFNYLSLFFDKRVEWIFISFFIFSSIYFYNNFGYQFRQTGDVFSSGGNILYVNYITKVYIKLFLFKQIILVINPDYKIPTFKLLIVILGSILSTSAALDVLIPLFCILILINKKLIYDTKARYLFFSSFFFFLLAFLVMLIGTSNKTGFEQGFILISENFSFFIKTIIRRISTWNQSISVYIEILKLEVFYSFYDLISSIFKNLLNRIEILFGGARNLPELWSSSRVNYLNLFWDNSSPRSGTSPGIIASSLLFYFPIGLIFFSLLLGQYYKYVYHMIKRKVNILSHVFILMVIILPFVSAPLDLINFINPSQIFFIFLVSLKYHLKSVSTNNNIHFN